MPRKRITSTKQLKADRLLKRAVKRGDAPAPDPAAKKPKRPRKGGPKNRSAVPPSQSSQNAVESSRKLQSAFIKLPPSFLEDTKLLASSLILPRPIKPEDALLPAGMIGEEDDAMNKLLTCPKRPKWRFDMSKKEVETNEEGLHKKWITQMDEIVSDWQKGPEEPNSTAEQTEEEEAIKPEEPKQMPRSPTYFERNLEVWRQLWRVVEISQIILVLLDSRCPLLHFPPSLSTYLSDRKVILVLTKVDISGAERAASWTRYLNAHYPGLRVVQVEAYTGKTESAQHQGRTLYEPHLPEGFKERLVQAIRELHAEMIEPPEKIKGNEEKINRWKPNVKTDIDWEGVLKAGGGQVGSVVGGAAAPQPKPDDDQAGEPTDQVPEFLTIGLIGQPNVGKSSLLNALFGAHKVRASKTPGKTKHFQTLFWTPDVRIVDCPGLVMPNFVPMEMQVLAGILPISRVSAIPACIHFSAQHIPLERIFGLTHPSLTAPPVEDKRTWRGGVRPSAAKEKEPLTWTAMDILIAYADKKGWITAKAGRPDIGRAGNALLRWVAEGKIRWAFWPPDADASLIGGEAGDGIWIPHATQDDDDSDLESEEEHNANRKLKSSESSESEEESDSEETEEADVQVKVAGIGRFGALGLNDEKDEEEEESDSNSNGDEDD